jgi:hypothetical protein
VVGRTVLATAVKRRLVVRYMGPGATPWPVEPTLNYLEIYWSRPEWLKQRSHPTPVNVKRLLHDDTMCRKYGSVAVAFKSPGALSWDAYMLADDDLSPRGCTISQVFDAFEASGARIAHPGLTRDSICSHKHLFVETPARLAVPIDFTELQCPLFTRAALVENLPEFGETVSCHGLERLWAKREREAGRDVYRLDTVPMVHGRALTYGTRSGAPAVDDYGRPEAVAFMQRHGCVQLPPMRDKR